MTSNKEETSLSDSKGLIDVFKYLFNDAVFKNLQYIKYVLCVKFFYWHKFFFSC